MLEPQMPSKHLATTNIQPKTARKSHLYRLQSQSSEINTTSTKYSVEEQLQLKKKTETNSEAIQISNFSTSTKNLQPEQSVFLRRLFVAKSTDSTIRLLWYQTIPTSQLLCQPQTSRHKTIQQQHNSSSKHKTALQQSTAETEHICR